jgi:hypothetical protein
MRHAGDSAARTGGAFRTFGSVVIGVAAGGGLYFWQQNVQLAIAAFVIVAHAATVFIHFHRAALLDVNMRRELGRMQINTTSRRVLRLLGDPYFWWSLFFGVATIDIACWFAGLHDPVKLALIGLAWGIISVMLGFDLTLLYPTTRCRHCGYQLIGLLDYTDPSQTLTCPECGRTWTKAQLCLVPPGWRNKPAAAKARTQAHDADRGKATPDTARPAA